MYLAGLQQAVPVASLLLELVLQRRDLLRHAADLLVVRLQLLAHRVHLALALVDARLHVDATLLQRLRRLHRLVNALTSAASERTDKTINASHSHVNT